MLAALLPPGMALLNYIAWGLAVPIAIVIGVWYYRNKKRRWTSRNEVIFTTAFITGMILVMLLAISAGVADSGGKSQKVHNVVSEKIKIAALQDNPGVEGHVAGGFLFISGNVTGEIKYSYYMQNADGTLIPVTKSENEVQIVPSTEESPTVYRFTTAFDDPNMNYWFYTPPVNWRENIVVPPDAIKRQYSTDLK